MRRKLLLLVASVLCCILAVEVGLRIFTPQWLAFRMTELNQGTHYGSDQDWPVDRKDERFYRFTPLSQFQVTHPEFSYITHIDELGGRKNNTHGDLVPFLGDSFSFGVGVEDSETFISLLKTNHRLLNLGVPGTCLGQQLQIIRDRHVELGSPKVYVFSFFIGNDFNDLILFYRNKDNIQPTDNSTTHSLLWKVNYFAYHNPVLKRSYAVQLVKQGLRGASSVAPDPLFQMVNPANVDYRNEAQKDLGRALSELVTLSASLNFKPVFIIIPDRYQEQREGFKQRAAYYNLDAQALEPDYPTRQIRNQLDALHIPYFDMSSSLDGCYYVQDGHLTPLGHKRVAQRLESDGFLTTIQQKR